MIVSEDRIDSLGAAGMSRRRPPKGGDVDVIEQIVLRAFELPLETLRVPGRGRAPIAFARQVAMYMSHVHLGLSLSESARQFGRDRTTAAHACRIVEDRRDSRRTSRKLAAVDSAVACWLAAHAGAGISGEIQQEPLQ